jgi:hypothetical protein
MRVLDGGRSACAAADIVSPVRARPFRSAAIGLIVDANAAESFRNATLLLSKKAMELCRAFQAEANAVLGIKELAVMK